MAKKKKPNLQRISEEDFNKEVKHVDEKDVELVFENEEKINEKFQNKKSIKKYMEIAKNLFSMLRDYKTGAYKDIPWRVIASVALTLLYVLNPMDIMPDVIPFFGFIDDAGVLALLLKMIKSDFDQYLAWKENRSK